MIHADMPVPPPRCAYPVREGCEVTPLVDGVPAFGRICEAIESARASVWGTVAFYEHDAPMPGGRGSMFDVLDAAHRRGVDVRVVFWRTDTVHPSEHFAGTEVQRRWLDASGHRFGARWDALPGRGCHHQKTWLIDAGTAGEVGFVGGINLDHESTRSAPGHRDNELGHVHDVYAELRGPAATDVHHNFVQRWNGASERHAGDGHWPPGADAGDLAFPRVASPPAGSMTAQVSRSVQPGRYTDSTAAPGAEPLDVDAGERSTYDQYISAIDAARSTIYIEDQLLASPKVIGHLLDALDRGVRVVAVVPGHCHPEFGQARREAPDAGLFGLLAELDGRERFTLAALARATEAGFEEIYVHAKIMLVDDRWMTIGSTNIATQSFKYDTELNVSTWDVDATRSLRVQLLGEHLETDTSAMSDAVALELFARVAADNAARRERGEVHDGLAYRIGAADYGLGTPKRSVAPVVLPGV